MKRITVEDAAVGEVAKVDLKETASAVGSLQIESRRLDIKLRKAMGWTLILLLAGVNVWAFGLVTSVGLGKLLLSDNVLIAVVAATVADLAGIVIIMAKYLFPQRASH